MTTYETVTPPAVLSTSLRGYPWIRSSNPAPKCTAMSTRTDTNDTTACEVTTPPLWLRRGGAVAGCRIGVHPPQVVAARIDTS